MVTVRTKLQPREQLEVSEQEAQVLESQGLLYEGSEQDLAQLLAADPAGPLDPRPAPSAAPDKAPAARSAPAAADKAAPDAAKEA